MGMPYSKQINAAFDQVTPLVAAGFEVLQTTKNISMLLAAIQVLTVVFLAMILAVMLGVLISVNPDSESERQALVTPAMKWLAGWWINALKYHKSLVSGLWIIFVGCVIGGLGGVYYTARDPTLVEEPSSEDADGQTEKQSGGEDLEAIKKGESKQ